MHHERVTNTRTYTRAESQSRAFTKRRTSSGDNVCMEELSCRVPSIPPRIAAFTRAMKLENGDHDLDDTFKASTTVSPPTTSSILICRVYSLPIFIPVLEFRNTASSLTGLRARLPLENRDATFLSAIFPTTLSLTRVCKEFSRFLSFEKSYGEF